jgi:autoinducer 2-degrading protein
MALALAVTWRAKPGRENEVAELLKELSRRSQTGEPGCIHFYVHRSNEDPRDFLLYEQYVDDAAFEAHQQTDHFQALVLGRAIPELLEDRVRRYYSTL